MRIFAIFLAGCCCLPGRAETGCFHSVKEAALQAGVRDGEGFRLEGIRLDRVGGGRWARVVSCVHPERPGMAVRVADERPGVQVAGVAAGRLFGVGRTLVEIGSVVQVVQVEANVRLEVAGVAQESGAMGDAIRVRVGAAGLEHFVAAVVRGEGLVEMEAGR